MQYFILWEVFKIKNTDNEKDEPSCRICFGGSDEGLLISPCLCDGSVKYVHHECLLTWRRTCVKILKKCELCKFPYQMYRPKWIRVGSQVTTFASLGGIFLTLGVVKIYFLHYCCGEMWPDTLAGKFILGYPCFQ
eukprot:UN27932